MTGWWYTATPQPCSGCGGAESMVSALRRRCPACEGATPSTPAAAPSHLVERLAAGHSDPMVER